MHIIHCQTITTYSCSGKHGEWARVDNESWFVRREHTTLESNGVWEVEWIKPKGLDQVTVNQTNGCWIFFFLVQTNGRKRERPSSHDLVADDVAWILNHHFKTFKFKETPACHTLSKAQANRRTYQLKSSISIPSPSRSTLCFIVQVDTIQQDARVNPQATECHILLSS